MKQRIPIPKELSVVFASQWISAETKETVLYEYFEEFRDEIISHFDLGPYRSDKVRGEVDADSVAFTSKENDGIVMHDFNSGAVYIEFDEEAYYGCKDMNTFYDHQEKTPFRIDPEMEIIEFDLLEDFERDDEI